MKISVCLATYQGEKYIREQLDSILPQLGPDDEVVVSDDGSADATLAIIEGYGDHRITVYRNATNVGYTKNFERALAKATGDVIFIADQDDVWLPSKVKTMLSALENADLAVSDVTIVDGELNETHGSHFERYGVHSGFAHNFARTRYIGSSMALRRPLLDFLLPFPPRSRFCAYDYWITIAAEAYFDVTLVRTPLMLYRRHHETASTGGDGSPFPLWHRLFVRAYGLSWLLRRAPRAVLWRVSEGQVARN